jgi:hypothetical protein
MRTRCTSVGRVHGILVGTHVRFRDHRRRPAGDRRDVQVHVRGPRVGATLILCRVCDLAAIGGERVALTPAERPGRNVVLRPWCQVARRVSVGADDEQVRSRTFVPRVPVPEQEVVGDVRLHLVRRFRLVPSALHASVVQSGHTAETNASDHPRLTIQGRSHRRSAWSVGGDRCRRHSLARAATRGVRDASPIR